MWYVIVPSSRQTVFADVLSAYSASDAPDTNKLFALAASLPDGFLKDLQIVSSLALECLSVRLVGNTWSQITDIVIIAFWAGVVEKVTFNLMLVVLIADHTKGCRSFIASNELMTFITFR